MLATCANPSCSAFLCLEEGKLFRLENDPTLRSSKSNRVEYFWLCRRCSSTMTLRLIEDGTVATIPIPAPFRGVPEGVALTSTDRKKGLLLRSVSLLRSGACREVHGNSAQVDNVTRGIRRTLR
jgi:hypothetical protein